MSGIVTVAGELVSVPEYQETGAGKTARFGITVVARHRHGDEWVDDPPVTYEVVVSDDDGMSIASSLRHGDRVLVSGTARSEAGKPVIDAETIAVSVRFHARDQ